MKIMFAVLLLLLAAMAALWLLDARARRRRLTDRQRSLERQAERRQRLDEMLHRRRDHEVRRKRWVSRFLWKDRRNKRLTYRPRDPADD